MLTCSQMWKETRVGCEIAGARGLSGERKISCFLSQPWWSWWLSPVAGRSPSSWEHSLHPQCSRLGQSQDSSLLVTPGRAAEKAPLGHTSLLPHASSCFAPLLGVQQWCGLCWAGGSQREGKASGAVNKCALKVNAIRQKPQRWNIINLWKLLCRSKLLSA